VNRLLNMHKFHVSILFYFSSQQSALIIISKALRFFELFILVLGVLLTFSHSLPVQLLKASIVSDTLNLRFSHLAFNDLLFLIGKLR
jgi:hypothetical protein